MCIPKNYCCRGGYLQNNEKVILINIPQLTEECHKELRKEANDEVKQLQKDGMAEDQAKGVEDEGIDRQVRR